MVTRYFKIGGKPGELEIFVETMEAVARDAGICVNEDNHKPVEEDPRVELRRLRREFEEYKAREAEKEEEIRREFERDIERLRQEAALGIDY